MRDRLLKESDVIEAVTEYISCDYPTEKDAREDVELLIGQIPSADRPQGKWIAVSAFDAFGGDGSTWMVHGNPTAFHYCSECKEQTRIDEFGEEILTNYCPNCGARMKGADDETTND